MCGFGCVWRIWEEGGKKRKGENQEISVAEAD
jgi:hypothetical protein